MKRNILFGSVLAAALSVGVGAQGQAGSAAQAGTPGQPGSQGTQSSSSRQAGGKQSDENVTVTGCLQAADGSGTAASTSTAGASSSASGTSDASKADRFILAKATMGGGASGSAMGSSTSSTRPAGSATGTSGSSSAAGTSGSSSSGSMDTQFVLSGGKKDELRSMANSKVEVTGKIENGPSAGTSNNGASSSQGTTGSAMSTGSRKPETPNNGRTLKIDSIRKISGSCS